MEEKATASADGSNTSAGIWKPCLKSLQRRWGRGGIVRFKQ